MVGKQQQWKRKSPGSGNRGRGSGGSRGSRGNGVGRPNKRPRYSHQQQEQDRKPKAMSATSEYDVYQESSDDDDNRKRDLDDVGNVMYHVDHISDDDDEEIDEDEAFDSEDEERWGIFFHNKDGSKSKKPRKNAADDGDEEFGNGDIDLNEDEEKEEDEDEDDMDEDVEGMIDLSDMLNDEPPAASSTVKSASSTSKPKHDPEFMKSLRALLPEQEYADEDEFESMEEFSEEDDEEESEDDEEEEEIDYEEFDQDEMAESKDKLTSFIDSITPSTSLETSNKKRKQPRQEVTEAYEESEYNLGAQSAVTSSAGAKKLDIGDLVGALKDTSNFGSLKQQLEQLEKGTKKSKTPVAAPLPKRVQERLNREAAYEQSKKDVSKWSNIVKQNREAEVLDLVEKPANTGMSSAALVGKFKPQTELELEVNSILQDSGMLEKKQHEFEEMELNKVSVEEMKERRSELARMRSLLFFKEQKLKKMSKIKSKAYRKLKKKEREKLQQEHELSIEELAKLDPEIAEQERLKAEAERARERMTQRHKNTSKWARELLSRKHMDTESRQAISEQLQRHEELQRKIQGLGNTDSDSEDLSGSDSEAIKSKALDAFDELEEEIEVFGNGDSEVAPKKGLMAMKFMQRAMETQKTEAKARLLEMKQQFENDELSGDDENDDDDSDDEAAKQQKKAAAQLAKDKESLGGKKIKNNVGRMMVGSTDPELRRRQQQQGASSLYDMDLSMNDAGEIDQVAMSAHHGTRVSGPVAIDAIEKVASKSSSLFMEPVFDEEEFVVEDDVLNGRLLAVNDRKIQFSGDKGTQAESESEEDNSDIAVIVDRKPARQQPVTTTAQQSEEEDEQNPWLVGLDEIQAIQKSKKSSSSTKELSKSEKSIQKLSQQRKKQQRDEFMGDANDVELNLEGIAKMTKSATVAKVLPTPASTPAAPSSTTTKQQPQKKKQQVIVDYVSDEDSDEEALGQKMVHTKSLADLSQRDLLQMAFANDDLVEREFEEEKQGIIDRDAPKDQDVTLPGWGSWGGKDVQPRKRVIKKAQPGIDGIEETKRQDAKLKFVIINEKRNKKAAQYMLPDVPHGFENREQYESTLRMPLGKEWNTSGTFKNLNMPRIKTKAGAIIHPLKFVRQPKDSKKPQRKVNL